MKRLEALKLIANQLDFIYGKFHGKFHGKFQGARTEFESQELADADVILTTLEQAGMLPPPDTIDIRAAEKETGVVYDISYNNPLNDDYSVNFWEKE